MDQLNNLPIDLFIKQVTYLPFEDVVSLCRTKSRFHNYCVDDRYNLQWKALINNTFSSVDNYEEKLKQIQTDLGYNNYNYLVYTQFIKYLDPITQLMIYYRQGDWKSFNNEKFNNKQKFLTMFLLGKKDEMDKYLPSEAYLPFIDLLNKKQIPQDILDNMLIEMALHGSLKGVKYFVSLGANIHDDERALIEASENGHLDVVKYLIEQGADIHADYDVVLRYASFNGHLDVVKYLIEQGADVHGQDDAALRDASENGHLNVVKYLVEQGADIHAQDDAALRDASERGHLDVVKYLVEHGADIYAENNWALRWASTNGHLDVVKYLVEHGADVHDYDDFSIIYASKHGHLDVVKYLVESGANYHAQDDKALQFAREEGQTEIVNYLKSLP